MKIDSIWQELENTAKMEIIRQSCHYSSVIKVSLHLPYNIEAFNFLTFPRNCMYSISEVYKNQLIIIIAYMCVQSLWYPLRAQRSLFSIDKKKKGGGEWRRILSIFISLLFWMYLNVFGLKHLVKCIISQMASSLELNVNFQISKGICKLLWRIDGMTVSWVFTSFSQFLEKPIPESGPTLLLLESSIFVHFSLSGKTAQWISFKLYNQRLPSCDC